MHRKSMLCAMFPYIFFYLFTFTLTIAIKATNLTNNFFNDLATDIMSILYVFIVTVSPVYTSWVCYGFIKKGVINYFGSIVVMLVSVLVGVSVIYFSWGFATRNLFNPDSETVLVMQFAFIASIIIAFICWVIMFAIFKARH